MDQSTASYSIVYEIDANHYRDMDMICLSSSYYIVTGLPMNLTEQSGGGGKN